MNRPPGRYKLDNSGLYPINVNGKYGFMDRSGKTVIAPQFNHAYGFSEGLAAVMVGDKTGYINTKGSLVITPQFDTSTSVGPFRYGRALVQTCGNRACSSIGFIDKDGKYITSPNFLWAGEFSGDLAPVRTPGGVMAFVNRAGVSVPMGNVDNLRESGFAEGLAPAASGGKWGFIDATGKWIIDPQFEEVLGFANRLAPVKVGGRWGYVDKKGKFVVNPQYDSGSEFYGGFAAFTSGGKYGFLDASGHEAIGARFLFAGNFSEGLAPVKTIDGWGFIDPTGKMVISPQFDSAEGFQNGLARITALDKEAYITKTGRFVVEPFPGTTVPAEKARRAAEAAATASRFAGEWAGSFGAMASRLTITSSGGAIHAVFSLEGENGSGNNGGISGLDGELLDHNRLRLTWVPTRSWLPMAGSVYDLELSSDGGSLTGQLSRGPQGPQPEPAAWTRIRR